jgi:hypothetical protein
VIAVKNKSELISIQILNWDEYQTRKDLKTMSWFRLESNLPEHEAFFNLSNDGKWFFVYLLCLCAKKSTGIIKVKLNYLEHYSQVKKDIIIKSLDIMNEYGLIRYEFVTDSFPTDKQTDIHNTHTYKKSTYVDTHVLHMENENENENVNVNDNVKENIKDKKTKYGKFKNVKLTEKEFLELQNKFKDELDKWINTLDEGIELKGYKYKSHYLAILKWHEKDKNNKIGNNSIDKDINAELKNIERL